MCRVHTVRTPEDIVAAGLLPYFLREITTAWGCLEYPLKIIYIRTRAREGYKDALRRKCVIVRTLEIEKLEPPVRSEAHLLVLPRGFFSGKTTRCVYGILARMRFARPCERYIGPELRLAYTNAQPYGERLVVVHDPVGREHNEFFTIENTPTGAFVFGATEDLSSMRPVICIPTR